MVSGLPVFQVDWSLELVQSVAACWVMMVDWAVTASPVPRARTMISGWVGSVAPSLTVMVAGVPRAPLTVMPRSARACSPSTVASLVPAVTSATVNTSLISTTKTSVPAGPTLSSLP